MTTIPGYITNLIIKILYNKYNMFRVVTKSENTPNIKRNDKVDIPTENKVKLVEKVLPDKNKIDLKYKPNPYEESTDIETFTINNKKEIEEQLIIYDKNTNEWKVINKSDSYLYNN